MTWAGLAACEFPLGVTYLIPHQITDSSNILHLGDDVKVPHEWNHFMGISRLHTLSKLDGCVGQGNLVSPEYYLMKRTVSHLY